MQNDGINGMTSFELEIMKKYISLNDVLFNLNKEEIDEFRKAADKAIHDKWMEEPSVEEIVEEVYLKNVSKVLDEIRETYPVAEEIIDKIKKELNQYYSMVFSKLQMVQTKNGDISSYDLCLNYRNCKVASEELALLMKQKEQLKKI